VVFTLAVEEPPEPTDPLDPCCISLVPGTRKAGIGVASPPKSFPRPPLPAVDREGCITSAWSVHAGGYVLVPSADAAYVELWRI